jgi:hypothetical protein
MEVNILKECGYEEALLGLSLSYNQEMSKMPNIALNLSHKDGGHNKFLESIVVWIDLKAPRYFHSQFDTYRSGVSKQSESTMHTIMKRNLNSNDFESPILTHTLEYINKCISDKNFEAVKNNLPEGFLQRRIICLNYKVLRNIILQRKTHKLEEWKIFIHEIKKQIEHKELLP